MIKCWKCGKIKTDNMAWLGFFTVDKFEPNINPFCNECANKELEKEDGE